MRPSQLLAIDRLIVLQNLRTFELWLAEQVLALSSVTLDWAAARVAVVRTGDRPLVLVLLGLPRRSWLLLGLVHLWAWWRMRQALGKEQLGYRVRVRVL